MCWFAVGDEVHVDSGTCSIQEGLHQFHVVYANLRYVYVPMAVTFCLSMEFSDTAEEVMYMWYNK
jgi:hypothetical protein